ncbi:hypothetical protein [Campylobacter sp.]|uniref:hypothetical protein n=1 Tax=Campylobacter sp. TaxID=205 RepID=UPI0026DD255C|nr:hypothetical protein [Campylobacter sp.]MDO4674102.1 hypothetical protein [Campylobacter sp.]
MKRVFLICGLFTSIHASSEQDAYFSHLQKRTALDFSSLHSPFANPTLQHLAQVKIQAIFPGKVKINGTWYRQDDALGEAIIKHIGDRVVVLEYDGERISVALENVKMAIH